MTIPDYYFACGASHFPLLDQSSHEHITSRFRECLSTEIQKCLADHPKVVVLQITTLFESYRTLPCGAWNHEVVERVKDEVNDQLRVRLGHPAHLVPSCASCPDESPFVRVVWARFHGSQSQPGYRQYWLVGADQFMAIGDGKLSSSEKIAGFVERAWTLQQSPVSVSKLQVSLQDQFYLSHYQSGPQALWLAFDQLFESRVDSMYGRYGALAG